MKIIVLNESEKHAVEGVLACAARFEPWESLNYISDSEREIAKKFICEVKVIIEKEE